MFYVQVSACVLDPAGGSNKFMTSTVALQLNWPEKGKKISLSGLTWTWRLCVPLVVFQVDL